MKSGPVAAPGYQDTYTISLRYEDERFYICLNPVDEHGRLRLMRTLMIEAAADHVKEFAGASDLRIEGYPP